MVILYDFVQLSQGQKNNGGNLKLHFFKKSELQEVRIIRKLKSQLWKMKSQFWDKIWMLRYLEIVKRSQNCEIQIHK